MEIAERWTARRVQVHLTGPGHDRELELTSAQERWFVDGSHDPALDGCTDVDLRVWPSTYRYRSGGFVADIEVDEAGMVLAYGDQYWRSEAAGTRV